MQTIRLTHVGAIFFFSAAICVSAIAQDSTNRKEMKRADLSGAPGMEVVGSIVEYKPGETMASHFHHGIETAYVIQGAMIQLAGKEASMLETGAVLMNLRDVVHGGFKVIGDKPLKLFTAHIVDKGKPLYAEPK